MLLLIFFVFKDILSQEQLEVGAASGVGMKTPCRKHVGNASGGKLTGKDVGDASGGQLTNKDVGNASGGQLTGKDVGNASEGQLKDVGSALSNVVNAASNAAAVMRGTSAKQEPKQENAGSDGMDQRMKSLEDAIKAQTNVLEKMSPKSDVMPPVAETEKGADAQSN